MVFLAINNFSLALCSFYEFFKYRKYCDEVSLLSNLSRHRYYRIGIFAITTPKWLRSPTTRHSYWLILGIKPTLSIISTTNCGRSAYQPNISINFWNCWNFLGGPVCIYGICPKVKFVKRYERIFQHEKFWTLRSSSWFSPTGKEKETYDKMD